MLYDKSFQAHQRSMKCFTRVVFTCALRMRCGKLQRMLVRQLRGKWTHEGKRSTYRRTNHKPSTRHALWILWIGTKHQSYCKERACKFWILHDKSFQVHQRNMTCVTRVMFTCSRDACSEIEGKKNTRRKTKNVQQNEPQNAVLGTRLLGIWGKRRTRPRGFDQQGASMPFSRQGALPSCRSHPYWKPRVDAFFVPRRYEKLEKSVVGCRCEKINA